MKVIKLICCLAAALLFSAPSPEIVFAEAGDYARADSRNVYFCTKRDLSTAIFTIPYTYCVNVLSEDGDWYYVSYAENNGLYETLRGYCKKEGLTRVDEPPQNVYLNKTVRVTFHSDSSTGGLPVLDELNVTAAFYGTFYSGPSAYSYVRYDGSFGYISGANDDYPLNEIPEDKPPEDPAKETGGADSKVIIAIVLAAVAAAALVILYFTGKKSKYFTPRS